MGDVITVGDVIDVGTINIVQDQTTKERNDSETDSNFNQSENICSGDK